MNSSLSAKTQHGKASSESKVRLTNGKAISASLLEKLKSPNIGEGKGKVGEGSTTEFEEGETIAEGKKAGPPHSSKENDVSLLCLRYE